MQRHADAADHGAENLARGKLGIKNAASGHGVHDARYTDDPDLLVDPDLGENRGMRVVGIFAVLVRLGACLLFNAVDIAGAHGVGERYLDIFAFMSNSVLRKCHVFDFCAGERRPRDSLRESKEFLPHLAACSLNGAADR